MLSKRQFDILIYLLNSKKQISQRKLAAALNISLGTTNKDVQVLSKLNFIKGGEITTAGIKALEPYKVERAIFMAAGIGSRLIPLTVNTPKPLLKVGDKRIIEPMLDALLSVGIEEIYLVRGHLKSEFDVLLKDYPMLKFIDNLDYDHTNNISSARLVKDYFSKAYVFDSDLLLNNKDLISKYQYASNYVGVFKERTDEWCLKVSGKYIYEMALGGRDCYRMYGISYWSFEDGKKISKHIERIYNSPGGKERFWDQIPLEFFKDDYQVRVRPIKCGDVVEVSSLRDLISLDNSYKEILNK